MNWDNRDLYKGFEINKNRIGWYGAIEGSLFDYIHRDGGIHQSCGSQGFFETKDEVKGYIDRYHIPKKEDDVYLERCGVYTS